MDEYRADGIGFEDGYRRRETDPCERGTTGCCVRHDGPDGGCETW